jgi:hypothetical protein
MVAEGMLERTKCGYAGRSLHLVIIAAQLKDAALANRIFAEGDD